MGKFGQYDSKEHCLKSLKADGVPLDAAQQVCDAITKKLKSFEKKGSFQYIATLKAEGERKAKIFLINDEVNLNKWGVTREAMTKGIKTVIGKPLIGPPNKGHDGKEVAKFISAGIEGDTGFGIVQFSDDNAWNKVRAGEWKYVSPEVSASCGIRESGQGDSILPCFNFEHVAMVNEPAYGTQDAKIVKSFIGVKSFAAGLESVLVNKEVKSVDLGRNHMNECEKITAELTDKFTAELKGQKEIIEGLNEKLKASTKKIEEIIPKKKVEASIIPKEIEDKLKVLIDYKAATEKANIDTLRAEVLVLAGEINTVSKTEEAAINTYNADTLQAVKNALQVAKNTLDTRPTLSGPKVNVFGASDKNSKIDFGTFHAITKLGGGMYR